VNVRVVALEILFEVHHPHGPHGSVGPGGVFAQERIHAAVVEHEPDKRSRRFLTELVLGVLRHEGTIDRVIAAHSDVKLDEIGPRALEALRLGAYQLLWLDAIPAFAAVSESVSAVRDRRAKPFVNGVLRAIDRKVRRVPIEADRGGASPRKRLEIGGRKVCFFSRDVFADPDEDKAGYLAQLHSHPRDLVVRWLARHGEETTKAMLEHGERPPPLFVRANRLKGTREKLLERLRSEEIRCGEGARPESVRVLAPPTELVATKAFAEGWCTVQDETAMGVAPALDAKPGQLVLDLCAAPGGKATHVAELTDDAATILAVDQDASRLDRVRETIARLGLKSVACMVADATDEEAIKAVTPAPYDRVLIDAPCSNSGVLARRPEAKARLTKARLGELVQLQARILKAGVGRLFPGGKLAYSTCSLEPEENQEQVRALLAAHRELALISETETLPSKEGAGGDGGYVAVLEKKGVPLPATRSGGKGRS
jgi:16S rRNA (cytosine967-C5)-methyltransferase